MAGLFGGRGPHRPSEVGRSAVPPPGPPRARRGIVDEPTTPLPPGLQRRPLPPPMGDPQKARADLRKVIAALNEEQQRLTGLTSARERAMTEHHAALDALRNAEAELREATINDPVRLAFAYANGQQVSTEPVKNSRPQ